MRLVESADGYWGSATGLEHCRIWAYLGVPGKSPTYIKGWLFVFGIM